MINGDYLVITCLFPSGRVGRAGRSGIAYSMICQDEMPYVYDLHLFLGRPVQFAAPEHTHGRLCRTPGLMSSLLEAASRLVSCHDLRFSAVTVSDLNLPSTSPDSEGVFGRVPQSILDDESSHLITAHENSLDLQNLHRVSENAYKQYLKSRPNPSPESIRRVKSTDMSCMAVHPLLGQSGGG